MGTFALFLIPAGALFMLDYAIEHALRAGELNAKLQYESKAQFEAAKKLWEV